MSSKKAIKFNDRVLEEATFWHARIADEAAQETVWLAFTDWLEKDDQHQCAFDHVENMMADMLLMKQSILVAFPDQIDIKQADKCVPVSKPSSVSKRALEPANAAPPNVIVPAAWRWQKPAVWAGLSAVAATIMLVFVNVNFLQAPEVVTEVFITQVGEQRMIELADGSNVHLNTNTKIEVTLEDDTRRTKLAYGEAVFTVAKDKDRPFFVDVGTQKIRVVGTKFNVLRYEGTVTVTVAEGIVDVAPTDQADTEAHKITRLVAGKQLVHAGTSVDNQVADVNADTVLAWQSGLLSFENAELSDTIYELSRYFNVPIKVEGDISRLTFSGVLNIHDPQAVLLLLEETLPIKIIREDTMITVTAVK